MKKIVMSLLVLVVVSGCAKAPSEETPTTTTLSIETTPSATTATEPTKLVDENGYPMYPNDDEHKGYQAYRSEDPNDKFSVINVPQFSNEEYMEAYYQCKVYIKPIFAK